MADFDCDLCSHEGECLWQYSHTICRVEQIKAAKVVVDDEYNRLFASLLKKNEELGDERIDTLLSSMREILHDSYTELPTWANK